MKWFTMKRNDPPRNIAQNRSCSVDLTDGTSHAELTRDPSHPEAMFEDGLLEE